MRAYVEAQALNFSSITEELDSNTMRFDDLVDAELKRRGFALDYADETAIGRLVVTEDLAFEIGVAVGRMLR